MATSSRRPALRALAGIRNWNPRRCRNGKASELPAVTDSSVCRQPWARTVCSLPASRAASAPRGRWPGRTWSDPIEACRRGGPRRQLLHQSDPCCVICSVFACGRYRRPQCFSATSGRWVWTSFAFSAEGSRWKRVLVSAGSLITSSSIRPGADPLLATPTRARRPPCPPPKASTGEEAHILASPAEEAGVEQSCEGLSRCLPGRGVPDTRGF